MISKLKIVSLLIVTNIISTPKLDASFRQKVQTQFTVSNLSKTLSVLIGPLGIISTYYLIKYQSIKENNLQLCTDPELLCIFNTIKKDMGITTHIPLYIQSDARTNNLGSFWPSYLGISLNIRSLNKHPVVIIQTLAHELGHYLQYTHDPKSYHPTKILPQLRLSQDQETLESFKKEVGADANAAGYQDCQDCLRHLQKNAPAADSIGHTKGYFDPIDYQPYVKRAVENNWLCPAHQAIRNQPVIRKIQHTLGFSQHKHPLHAYLPQTYDRSNY